MIGNVKQSSENIGKVNGIKINVEWLVSFIIWLQTLLNPLKKLTRLLHYQVQSASLRVVHFFSIYKEFSSVSLRRKKKFGFAHVFAREAAMRHGVLWGVINTVVF